VVMIK